MEWEFIAPMIMSVVFILTVGGVVVLKPVMNRLVELLEVMARAKGAGGLDGDPHVRDLLESMNSRLALLEDRQDFTDRLLEARQAPPKSVPPGDRTTLGE
jgi:hypothetical protein